MSKFLIFYLLMALTGSPLAAIVLLLGGGWALDRLTLRILPSPLRFLRRWQRGRWLRDLLAQNPHDRRARLELAEILITQRRHKAAVEVLKPNLTAGDDDAVTLFVMGIACLGAEHVEQGEIFLDAAKEREPTFRIGAIDLELGRHRLARGDAKAAREALEAFLRVRTGSVEGRYLLAKAIDGTGDGAAAKQMREAAWADYVSLPRFQRRQERQWAWRARPSRPLTYLAIGLACAAIFTRFGAPAVRRAVEARPHESPYEQADYDE